MASLPETPALRREQIKLQVALIYPVTHVKGYASPETRTTAEQAHLLIEKAEALGEPLEDHLFLFKVLHSLCLSNYFAINGDAFRELSTQLLALAQKQDTTVPLSIGHRLMGLCLMLTGDIMQGRAHYDQALALRPS
jgi:hypothetical protein